MGPIREVRRGSAAPRSCPVSSRRAHHDHLGAHRSGVLCVLGHHPRRRTCKISGRTNYNPRLTQEVTGASGYGPCNRCNRARIHQPSRRSMADADCGVVSNHASSDGTTAWPQLSANLGRHWLPGLRVATVRCSGAVRTSTLCAFALAFALAAYGQQRVRRCRRGVPSPRSSEDIIHLARRRGPHHR